MSTASGSRPLPRPLHLVSNSTGTSGLPTSLSAGVHAPLSAPLSRNYDGMNGIELTKSRPGPRRQSSISYNTGISKARSSGLGRSNSLGSKTVLDGMKEGGRNGVDSAPRPSSLPSVRETEPVTLAEKHADLLRFIAQKESKCLELRTQLAQHEADLLLLKRKWERIVSKGSPSSTFPRKDGPASVGSDVLDGIREGMQSGLGKMFAVLEPSLACPSSSPQPPSTTSESHLGRRSQLLSSDTTSSSSKRASISTASSISTRDRSSLSGSRSSASSLFDDLSSLDQSPTSSVAGDSTICLSPYTDKTSGVAQSSRDGQTSSALTQPPSEETGPESFNHDDDPSSKRRRSRRSSINLSQLSSPLAASLSSGSTTPLSRQMANWVPPSLNKKWEEIKSSEALSKQSKRASILLNDVLAVLAPPASPSPALSSSTPARKSKGLPSPSQHTLDSAFFDPIMGTSACTGSGSMTVSLSPTPSLLDEEDGCGMGEVLQPEVKTADVAKGVDVCKKRDEDIEEDEWNW